MKVGIDKDKHWYVVRTNVKAEIKASENIRKVGYDVYFPRRRVEVQHRRTKCFVVKEQPLMPRYLFVGFPSVDLNFYRVDDCDGVECILGIDGNPLRVPGVEVEVIYLAEIDMHFDDTRAARIYRREEAASVRENIQRQFPAGTIVSITNEGNPFSQHRAIVEEVTSSGKVRALIEVFGRMASVEFRPKELFLAE